MQATDSAVRREIVVKAPAERAFAVFTAGFDTWWPRSHHIGAADLDAVVIEPRAGGRWIERGVDGSEVVWGEVLVWDPPHRLRLSWRLDGTWSLERDPERCSEIEVTFTVEGDATRVALVHGHLERHTRADDLREGVGGEGGWKGLLVAYSAAVG